MKFIFIQPEFRQYTTLCKTVKVTIMLYNNNNARILFSKRVSVYTMTKSNRLFDVFIDILIELQ